MGAQNICEIPWTLKNPLDTFELKVPFGYLGPLGTFWVPLGPLVTFWTFTYVLDLKVPFVYLGTSWTLSYLSELYGSHQKKH